MERVKLKVRVTMIFESGIMLRDENNISYTWFTRNYKSKLFYATDNEWYTVTASKFIFDHPTPKNGLKNVRIIKE